MKLLPTQLDASGLQGILLPAVALPALAVLIWVVFFRKKPRRRKRREKRRVKPMVPPAGGLPPIRGTENAPEQPRH